jgi:hypothetical protein
MRIFGHDLPAMRRCDETKPERGHEFGNEDIQWEIVRQVRHHQHGELAQHGTQRPTDEHQYDGIKHGKSSSALHTGKRAAERGGELTDQDREQKIGRGRNAASLSG